MTKVKKLIKERVKKLLYERKISPQIGDLIDNAENVLGKNLKNDRTVSFSTVIPSPGVKSLMVSADVYGDKQYKTTLIFYDVIYSKTQDDETDTPVNVNNVGDMYFKKPDMESQCRVNCTCDWFRFACEWYLKPEDGLTPGKNRRPYTRKDGKPNGSHWSPNPKQTPCICKHIYQVAMEMKNRDMFSD